MHWAQRHRVPACLPHSCSVQCSGAGRRTSPRRHATSRAPTRNKVAVARVAEVVARREARGSAHVFCQVVVAFPARHAAWDAGRGAAGAFGGGRGWRKRGTGFAERCARLFGRPPVAAWRSALDDTAVSSRSRPASSGQRRSGRGGSAMPPYAGRACSPLGDSPTSPPGTWGLVATHDSLKLLLPIQR